MAESIPSSISLDDFQKLESLFTNFQSKYGLYPKHPRQSEFQKLYMDRDKFNAIAVMEILLDEEPIDTPFKCILAAGLCGWVIDPKDNSISENLMYLEAERILEECIAYASEMKFEQLALEEIFGKYILSGQNFYDDIVFPLYGASPYEYFSSAMDLEYEIQAEVRSFNSINYCLLVLHWMRNLGEPTQRYAPSWNSVRQYAAIQKKLSFKQNQNLTYKPVLGLKPEYTETRLREGWAKYMRSLSMLYTANYVKIPEHRTLLEMIVSTQLNTRLLLKVLPEWFEKSTYFYNNCLKPLENTAQSDEGEWLLKNVQQREFSPNEINQGDKNNIENILKKGIKSTVSQMKK